MSEINIRKVCSNCEDFDAEKSICTIRYVLKDKERKPLPRKANQRGCTAFMFNVAKFEKKAMSKEKDDMTKKERRFMFDLAELMAKYGVSLEATTINDSVYETPSIKIETVQIQDVGQSIDIDLYGCLYPADIINLARLNNHE